MNNSLALIPTQNEFAAMMQQADVLFKSGLLPQTIRSAQAVVAIMMLGRELNIPPWQAINSIHVISGKPTVSPQLMLALIERSGLQENIEIASTPTGCTVTMKRKGRTAHTESFTMENAKLMGLAGNTNYTKQPGTMCKWRAVAACARVVYPDVLMGIYTTEEIAPEATIISEDGEMAYTPKATPQLTIVAPPPPPAAEGEIVEDKAAGEMVENPRRIGAPVEKPVVETEPPTATWDTPNILDLLLKKCNKELADYVPELQPSDIMRLIGRPDKEYKVLAYWVEWYPTPKAAFEAIADAVQFEVLAN